MWRRPQIDKHKDARGRAAPSSGARGGGGGERSPDDDPPVRTLKESIAASRRRRESLEGHNARHSLHKDPKAKATAHSELHLVSICLQMDALTVDRQRGSADTQASSPVSPFDGRQLRRLSGQFTSGSRATASQPSPSEKVTTPTSKNFVPRHSVPSPATPSSQSAGERVPVTEQAPRIVNRWRKEPTSLPAQSSLALKNKETIDRRDRVNENPVRRSSKWTPPPPFKLSDRPGNYTKYTRRDSDRDRPGTSEQWTGAHASGDHKKTRDNSLDEKDADRHENRSDRPSAATDKRSGESLLSKDPPAASVLETPQALSGLLLRIGERYTNYPPSPVVQQRGQQRTSSSPRDMQPFVPPHTKETAAGSSAGPSRPRLKIVFRQPQSTDPTEPTQRTPSDQTTDLSSTEPSSITTEKEAVASPIDGSDPPGTHTFANRDAAQVDTPRTSRRQRYSSKTPSLGSLYTPSEEDPDSEAELPRYKPRGGVSRKEKAGQAQALANVQAEAPNRLLASSAPAEEAVVATASSGTAPVVGPVVGTSETVQSGFEEQNAPPAEIAGSVDGLLLQLATPASRAENRSRSRSAYSASPEANSPAKRVPAEKAALLPPINDGSTASATIRSAGTKQSENSVLAAKNTPIKATGSTANEVEEEVAGEDSDATLSASLFSERSTPEDSGDARKRSEAKPGLAQTSCTVLNGSVRLSPESSDEAELCAPTGDGMLTPPPTAALFNSTSTDLKARETPDALLPSDTVSGAHTLLSLRAARQDRGCDTPERQSGKESEDAASPKTHPSAVAKEASLDTAEPQSTPAGSSAEEAPQPDSAASPGAAEADSSRKRKEAPTPEPSAERPAPTRKRRKPATLEPEPLPWSCHKKTRTAAKLFYQAAGLLHKNASAEDRATINEWIATFDGLMED